jgi:hypothetical protein
MKNFYSYIFTILLIISCGKKEVEKEFVKDKNTVVVDTIKEVVTDTQEVVPELIFTVQIAALKNDSSFLKSIENIQTFEEQNLTKYRLGQFSTYEEARIFRASLLKNYPDAFVQALQNGNPISITEALK